MIELAQQECQFSWRFYTLDQGRFSYSNTMKIGLIHKSFKDQHDLIHQKSNLSEKPKWLCLYKALLILSLFTIATSLALWGLDHWTKGKDPFCDSHACFSRVYFNTAARVAPLNKVLCSISSHNTFKVLQALCDLVYYLLHLVYPQCSLELPGNLPLLLSACVQLPPSQ